MARRLSRMGLVLVLIVAFSLSGCSGNQQSGGTSTTGGNEKIGSVTVMGLWGGTELTNFKNVVKGWTDQTGGTMKFESTRDLSAVLRARVAGGNPPDVAILPNPALLKTFADQGKLQTLNNVLDMNTIQDQYASTWLDLATVNNDLYGVFVKAATKSTVWYDPKVFSAKGYQIPTTWDELSSLAAKMKADGTPPWSIGVEAGGASGWPASDWIQEIYLAENGPDKYDQWVNHEIPWTDPTVKAAFEKFGQMALTQGYAVGGPSTILATNFEPATYPPFQSPPKANMVFLGDFAEGFIKAQFKDLQPVTDFNFFKFVEINPAYKGSATGGADVVVMFKDTPTSRSFVKYLADPKSWESWAKAGGYSSPNKSFDASTYPDPVAVAAAQQLTNSAIFRVDADDSMPAAVQNAEWKALLAYIQKPDSLNRQLAAVEAVAKTAYAAQAK